VQVNPGASRLVEKLRKLGCHVIQMLCFRLASLTSPGCELEKKIENINDYTWLVFTSGVGVNIFFDYLVESGIDIRILHHLKIACVGTETEREVNKRGIKVDYCPAEYNGAALAHGLVELLKNGNNNDKLLIPRAKDGDEDLTRILADAGLAFDDVPIYEKIRNTNTAINTIIETITENDSVAFTSSSGVKGFVETISGSTTHIDFSKIKAVCIGEKTAATARSYGMEVYVSTEATIQGMVDKIKELGA
jgi:uroporphyrinogen III methyltransferase/synthase